MTRIETDETDHEDFDFSLFFSREGVAYFT